MAKKIATFKEIHIYCDKCNCDSASELGYSTGYEMNLRHIYRELKRLEWSIQKDKHYCSKCK